MPENHLIAPINELEHILFTEKEVRVKILRLDQIHPHISGNKLFKLHYFLQECLAMEKPSLITFGGAFSNHLAATAYAAQMYNIHATGIVRGEQPEDLSPTLQFCKQCGMEIQFISREDYQERKYTYDHHESVIIPEGGYHLKGVKGASLIMDQLDLLQPDYIINSVGSATTLAGLLSKNSLARIIAVPALKNMTDIPERLTHLQIDNNPYDVWSDYHFGGFGKYSPELISFMNEFYLQHHIPLDFVYTAKMMLAVMEKISENYFERGSTIVCLHTGGLQGNVSIMDQLIFDV